MPTRCIPYIYNHHFLLSGVQTGHPVTVQECSCHFKRALRGVQYGSLGMGRVCLLTVCQHPNVNVSSTLYQPSMKRSLEWELTSQHTTQKHLLFFIGHTRRFKESIIYHTDWKVESLSLTDQIIPMKLHHNYTNVDLA